LFFLFIVLVTSVTNAAYHYRFFFVFIVSAFAAPYTHQD